jgi:hypothetical protein
MSTFVFTYRKPTNYTMGTGDGMAAWSAWFESMGDRLVDLGKPVAAATTIGDCGRDLRQLGGYSVVEADDIDGAIALANGCPFVDLGGGVEIGELADLPTA